MLKHIWGLLVGVLRGVKWWKAQRCGVIYFVIFYLEILDGPCTQGYKEQIKKNGLNCVRKRVQIDDGHQPETKTMLLLIKGESPINVIPNGHSHLKSPCKEQCGMHGHEMLLSKSLMAFYYELPKPAPKRSQVHTTLNLCWSWTRAVLAWRFQHQLTPELSQVRFADQRKRLSLEVSLWTEVWTGCGLIIKWLLSDL